MHFIHLYIRVLEMSEAAHMLKNAIIDGYKITHNRGDSTHSVFTTCIMYMIIAILLIKLIEFADNSRDHSGRYDQSMYPYAKPNQKNMMYSQNTMLQSYGNNIVSYWDPPY